MVVVRMKNCMKALWVLCMLQGFLTACVQQGEVMDLSGEWSVAIDSTEHSVVLPGSLAENKLGVAVRDSAVNKLSEEFHYEGKAAFTKEIEIPENWESKPLELYMERTKYSMLYVNDSLVGTQSSVSAPHKYVLKNGLSKGKHQLKIVVDNTKSLLPLGGSHAYSEHTQTNWNGILGKFYLRRLHEVDVRSMRIDASLHGDCVLTVDLLKNTFQTKKELLKLTVRDHSGNLYVHKEFSMDVDKDTETLHLDFKIENPQLWDEYNPYLYSLSLESETGISRKQSFGIRDFRSVDGRLMNNDRVVFLRGKHEGGVFPLTGYPSMEKADWLKYLSTAQSYGINHIRCHSWTPPSAAFEAADELGVFLQVELPLWGKYRANDTALVDYMKAEGEKIMEAYGNHPSFVMFALGNELSGDTLAMASVVDSLKDIDKRHLYAMGSNNFFWDTRTYDCEDFFVSMRNGKAQPDCMTDLRGSFSFANADNGGIINSKLPNTQRDFSKAVQGLCKPVIGHETGQYQVYPDFKEMPLYKGVLKPLNFEVIKKRLEEKGLLEKSEDFLKASGALSVLCYREEIEMALRTKNFDGFQLLDLQDYPGQGTALVGILNAFMGTKNLITPEQWRRFCNDIVPLTRFSKFCWSSDEVLSVDVDIAHYGKQDLPRQTVSCALVTENEDVLYKKSFTMDLKQGEVNRIGSLRIPLSDFSLSNQKLSLHVELENTDYKNSWDLWTYSQKRDVEEGTVKGICVTRDVTRFNECVKKKSKVLYIPKHEDIIKNSVGGLFITDFWNYKSFRRTAQRMGKVPSPGTFGLLINSEHPIFNLFPTDFHTNWQWWNLVINSRPMILDDYEREYSPIVQVVDNWDRNHKLGLIYEVPESDGNAIICASDLFSCKENVEVKALFESILSYLQNR